MLTKRSFHYVAYLMVMLMMMLSVQSCSTMGYENVDTTRKAILVANAEVRAANLLLSDLVDRRAIDKDDAQSALNSLQSAKDHLQTALDAVNLAGDPVTAGNSLERANSAISIVMVLLAPLVET